MKKYLNYSDGRKLVYTEREEADAAIAARKSNNLLYVDIVRFGDGIYYAVEKWTADDIADKTYDELDVDYIRGNARAERWSRKDTLDMCREYCADYAPEGASKQMIGRAAVILADKIFR